LHPFSEDIKEQDGGTSEGCISVVWSYKNSLFNFFFKGFLSPGFPFSCFSCDRE
jgi:hypothetical protein